MAPNALADNTAHNAENTVLADQGRIYLEELDFASQICRTATAWADWIARNLFPGDIEWQQLFVSRFLVIPDLSFDFLSETGTEVHTRVRISDESKTVERGALWTEECLPAESILAGLIKCDRVFRSDGKEDPFDPSSLLERFAPVGSPLSLQIGGKATVGLGQVRCVFSEIGG
jgi:CRISPR-associated protein Cmr4